MESGTLLLDKRQFFVTEEAGLPTIDCHSQERELSKTDVVEQQLIKNFCDPD